jgi:flagellar biosynthesis protein FliQ
MSGEVPGALLREGLLLLALVGGPLLGTLLLVGLLVGVLQAATQVNDPAVGFLPRGLAAVAVVWLAGPWIMERLSGFLGQALLRMAGR